MKMGEAPDPELTSRMQKPCLKSRHPSVHICQKRPETDFARKVHRKLKALSKRLKKKQVRRKKKSEGGYWRKKKKKNKKRRRMKKSRKGNRRALLDSRG